MFFNSICCSAEEGEIQEEQACYSSVRPEEIPEVPENKFLMRDTQDDKPTDRFGPLSYKSNFNLYS